MTARLPGQSLRAAVAGHPAGDKLPRMRTRRSLTAPARTVLRLAGLLAVLAGLFGMHGLANHGVVGMENMPISVMAPVSEAAAAPDPTDKSAHPQGLSALVLDPAVGVAAAMVGPVVPAGMDMSMIGMCIAVLVLGLAALLTLGRIRRRSPVLWMLWRPGAATTPAGRDPDPPSLTVLSIQRC